MRRGLLIVLIGALALMLACSSDDGDPPRELVHHSAYPMVLEDLAGTYEFDSQPQDDPPRWREIAFEIPEPVDGFERLRLVLEGSWTAGLMEVAYEFPGGIVVYDTFTVAGRLQFDLTVPGDPEKIYRAVFGPQGGEFSASAYVEAAWPDGTVRAEDLLGESLEATLSCSVFLGDEDHLIEATSGAMTTVRLELLEAEVYEDGGGGGTLLGVR